MVALRPSRARTAVAPRATIIRGPTSSTSRSSHGAQALISATSGRSWMRRLPRGFHLKCLTALVT
jgi:hypothetical protein